jgi:hypothetical protein
LPLIDAPLETVGTFKRTNVRQDGVEVRLYGIVDIHPGRDRQLMAQVDVGRSVLPGTVQIEAVAALVHDSVIVNRTGCGEDVVVARRIVAVAVELPLRQEVAVRKRGEVKPIGLGSAFSSESFRVLSTTAVYCVLCARGDWGVRLTVWESAS